MMQHSPAQRRGKAVVGKLCVFAVALEKANFGGIQPHGAGRFVRLLDGHEGNIDTEREAGADVHGAETPSAAATRVVQVDTAGDVALEPVAAVLPERLVG